jgi:hypothetical protein
LVDVGDPHAHRREIAQDSREAAIRKLARRQSGNLTRAQLLELGLTAGGVDRRLRNGSLVTRYPGVYCQAPARQDPPALATAAVLAGGPHAVLSHASAAHLWGFQPRWPRIPELTLTDGDRRPRGIHIHRCSTLTRRDITRQLGIRVTTPARTALDLAPRLTTKARSRLVNDARHEGYLHLASLQDVLDRNPYHPGTKWLRQFVQDPTNPTRSPLEDDFLSFIKKYRLPTPQINVHPNGREVDAFFPDHKLIVELDGWEYHKHREAFEDDRERDAENLKHGLGTIRITRERLTEAPDREAARLQRILDRHRRQRR